jgi:Zn-dependent protease
VTCAGCGAEIGTSFLACPRCHTLVHAGRLKQLARDADDAKSRGDLSGEAAAWRAALELLPPGTAQHQTVHARVEQISATLIDTPAAATSSAQSAGGPAGGQAGGPRKMWTGGALSGLAALAWKGKVLLLGLTKSTTLLSMIPALGLYWVAFGWRFAAGLIASIYVHEMGHVVALTRFGIAASAPMFIPGLGAVIRSRAQLTNPREEARVGLGGPIWGLGAALTAYAIYRLTGYPIWAAIARFGAWVNLFNLLPVWQLDGAHAFKALNRAQRWFAASAAVGMLLITQEGLLVLIAMLAGYQAFRGEDWPDGDQMIAVQYAGLVAILSWMCVTVA